MKESQCFGLVTLSVLECDWIVDSVIAKAICGVAERLAVKAESLLLECPACDMDELRIAACAFAKDLNRELQVLKRIEREFFKSYALRDRWCTFPAVVFGDQPIALRFAAGGIDIRAASGEHQQGLLIFDCEPHSVTDVFDVEPTLA